MYRLKPILYLVVPTTVFFLYFLVENNNVARLVIMLK